jgi:pimeloyl-ACP methyl ester carboxylesterase
MPKTRTDSITINYDQQGSGEPLLLIPYLAADHACYAFQIPEYAKQFTCMSIDLRGTGQTDKPQEPYSFEVLADDVASFMQAVGISKAHVCGLSFGASVGTWLAPQRLVENRRLPPRRRRELAAIGERSGCSRDGDSWNFPVVFQTGAVRRQA